MFKLKELGHIALAILILIFVINFYLILKGEAFGSIFLINTGSIIVVVFINLFAKKLAAHFYDSYIESKIWMFQRYGLKREDYFKSPVPTGILVPFFMTLISQGKFYWLAALEFDISPSKARASKRHDVYKFSEMAEFQIALIAAAGIIANLLSSTIGYLIGFPEFTRLSIYYAAFCLLPLGQLDGTKIFFGNRLLWYSLLIIEAIFLGYAFLLV